MLVETSYLTNTKKLVCSYVDKSGDIKLKYFDWDNPMKYVSCEDNDPQKHVKYKSWDNKSVKQIEVNHPDRYAIYEFLDALPEKEKNEIFEFNLPKIYFIDIETEIVDGFPEAADIKDNDGNVTKEGASTQVLSISIVYDDKIILLGLKDMPEDMQERICKNTNKYFEKFGVEYKLKYVKYDDEFDMLYAFFNKMTPKMPILTGWNFLQYDWLYLVNRSRKLSKWINGKEWRIDPAVSSPLKRINKMWGTEFEVPAHRMIFDYMQLYEICDTSIKVKESSSLDFVSSKLVGVDKIKYTGSLQKLYEDDFETFMYYNAVDSVLVQKIHDSRNDMDNIVLFKDDRGGDSAIAGGWVKDPVVGMNQWVVVYDFASLYPTTMDQFFIAPENFVGIQNKNNKDFCDNGREIDLNEHVVCVNGVVFRKRVSPTIKMIQDVYKDRKFNKNIMMKKKDELKLVMDEIKMLEESL
jgi:DNA polymerase elongation subunit (family B)